MSKDEFNVASGAWSAISAQGLPTASHIFVESSGSEGRFGSAPALDHGKYLHQLDGLDLSDDQKRELLDTVWSIMRAFVELGFSSDLGASACGQEENSYPDESRGALDGVHYSVVVSASGSVSPTGKAGPK